MPTDAKSRERAAALKEIGKRVAFARGKMTKAALARHCGFADPSSITRVEDGLQMLDVVPLIKASRALGVSIDWILTGDGDLPARAPVAPADADRRRRQA
jgi:transcriptional regulator with XRE-family HTH domain